VEVCSHEKRWSRFLAAAENLWVVQRCCGEWWVLVGSGARLCLGYNTFWQVKFQECVNDSYYVWSSFLYISYSYQYIQHIECRV